MPTAVEGAGHPRPAKVRPGYANFAVAAPPLKLVLLENPGHGGTLHLGIEAASADAVREEIATICCYAGQDARV